MEARKKAGFEGYDDPNEWREKYFNTSLEDLYQAWEKLDVIRIHLSEISAKPLNEALKNNFLEKALLGGLTRDGGFSDMAMAKFCNEFLGLKISDFSGFKYELMEGVEREKAAVGKSLQFEETDFAKVSSDIGRLTKQAIGLAQKAGLAGEPSEPPFSVDELEDEPAKVGEIAGEFIEKALSLTPTYNRHTFFLRSLNQITKRYMEIAYPKTESDEVFDDLINWFGLTEMLVPERTSEGIKEDYTIYEYDNGTLGDLLIRLSDRIWDLSTLSSVKGYFGIENECEKFVEKAKTSFKTSLGEEELPDFPQEECDSRSNLGSGGTKPLQTQEDVYRFEWHGISGMSIGSCEYPFGELLDEISPLLFLDLGHLSLKDDKIEYRQIKSL